MSRNIRVGIDIGTTQVKIVVAEANSPRERSMPRILGMGSAESKGLRHGYITNTQEAARSIRQAANQAEKAAGQKIKKAYLSIGGVSLLGIISTGSIVISRADSEVTEMEIQKAIQESENEIPKSLIQNRKIIHTIPLAFRIDGKPVLGRPHGLKGMKLEAKTLFVAALEHHIDDLIQAVEEAGIDVEDVSASPMAASLVTVNKLQKMAGCVLANIGAETVSIVVFENNLPISLEVFPIGSNDITNDIALGLKIPLEEAENIKTGVINNPPYSRKKLEEIIQARLSDIFELIETHLKKLGRNGLLPAGIILTGGGSGLAGLEEFAKYSLKLPSKVAGSNILANAKGGAKDATWAVSYGLCILGFSSNDEEPLGSRLAKNTKKSIFNWFKQFLP